MNTLQQHNEIERLKTLDIVVSVTYSSKRNVFNSFVFYDGKKYHVEKANLKDAINNAIHVAQKIENEKHDEICGSNDL